MKNAMTVSMTDKDATNNAQDPLKVGFAGEAQIREKTPVSKHAITQTWPTSLSILTLRTSVMTAIQ